MGSVDERSNAGGSRPARSLSWMLVGLGLIAVVVSAWVQYDFMSGEVPARWRVFTINVVGALGGPLLIAGLVGLVLARLRP